jgi:hypothetical protein
VTHQMTRHQKKLIFSSLALNLGVTLDAWAGNRFIGVFGANERVEQSSRPADTTEPERDEIQFKELFTYDQTVRIRPVKKWSDWFINSRFFMKWDKNPKVYSLSPKTESDKQFSVEARQLALEGSFDSFALRLGLQEVVWGETLFAPVTDIWQSPNSKGDFFLDPEFRRHPQDSVNLTWAGEVFSAEGMVVPVPLVAPVQGVQLQPRKIWIEGSGS